MTLFYLCPLPSRSTYNKTSMITINIFAERCEELANCFGCKSAKLAFTYLGLPICTTRPRVECFFLPYMENFDTRFRYIKSYASS
jgi:hypothetical protein